VKNVPLDHVPEALGEMLVAFNVLRLACRSAGKLWAFSGSLQIRVLLSNLPCLEFCDTSITIEPGGSCLIALLAGIVRKFLERWRPVGVVTAGTAPPPTQMSTINYANWPPPLKKLPYNTCQECDQARSAWFNGYGCVAEFQAW
jgi:hypothetical protein